MTIQQAEEGLELSGVVSGITVKNDSGTDVIVNGSKLNAGQSVTIIDPELPSEKPDYDYDDDYDDDDDDDDSESEIGTSFVKPNHADDVALPSISVKKPETETATETETKDFYMVSCYTLNVRSGPGTSYSTIGVLSGGMSVNVLDVLDGWYKIAFGNGVGYVSALYLS